MNHYSDREIEVLQTLLKIRQTNEHIALQLDHFKSDSMQVSQLQEHKTHLLKQLYQLLAEFDALPATLRAAA